MACGFPDEHMGVTSRFALILLHLQRKILILDEYLKVTSPSYLFLFCDSTHLILANGDDIFLGPGILFRLINVHRQTNTKEDFMAIVDWGKDGTVAIMSMNNGENRHDPEWTEIMLKTYAEIMADPEIKSIVLTSSTFARRFNKSRTTVAELKRRTYKHIVDKMDHEDPFYFDVLPERLKEGQAPVFMFTPLT